MRIQGVTLSTVPLGTTSSGTGSVTRLIPQVTYMCGWLPPPPLPGRPSFGWLVSKPAREGVVPCLPWNPVTRQLP